jgi:protein gp37
MGDKSTIEWTEATWNPTRGCDKISPGCKHCYAETFAERFRGVKGNAYEQGFDFRLVPDKLDQPKRWKRSRMIFTNSMSDIFHEQCPDDYIIKFAKVMLEADHHIYQVLTKRHERMRDLLNTKLQFVADLNYIWWGVSVEDQKYGLPRIDALRQANVKVRWLSVEPLLEDIGQVNLDGIHWLVAGGESGPGCRPAQDDWFRSLRDQCAAQKVPYFLKQLGGHPNKRGHDQAQIDGKEWKQWPDHKKL